MTGISRTVELRRRSDNRKWAVLERESERPRERGRERPREGGREREGGSSEL